MSGAETVLVDLADHFDPVVDRGVLSNASDAAASCDLTLAYGDTAKAAAAAAAAGDDDPLTVGGLDWTHANAARAVLPDDAAAAAGASGSYVLGVRSLSAVASFDAATGAREWLVSSEVASDVAFAREEGKFYNPHDAHVLPGSGNLLLFDNGDARPVAAGAAPFSRGVECEDASCANADAAVTIARGG